MDEEEALIRSFVISAKRQRMVELLANPKRRRQITASLAHFRDLDPRWIVSIPPAEEDSASIEQTLRRFGAGDTCYVISENMNLDGRRMALTVALDETVCYGMGTLISCRPGVLAYFEGEMPHDRFILSRPPGR